MGERGWALNTPTQVQQHVALHPQLSHAVLPASLGLPDVTYKMQVLVAYMVTCGV